jgi:DNA invertase Pin-like site-specific DNA recombinase
VVVFIGYVRQSREREEGLSPESQRAEIEHWASAPGREREVEFLPPDLDWSGKSLERPSMREALRRLRAGEADGIVVAKLDRLTRSVGDLNALIKEAKAGKWNIVALDLGVDLSTSNGKVFAQIVGVLSEWYLDRVTEEWAKTRRHKILTQGAHWGSPPLGYTRGTMVNSRGHTSPGALEVDAEWAPVVQELFRRRGAANGERASWTELARYLTELGAPCARTRASGGTAVWSTSAVIGLLANRAYLGEARAGSLVKRDAHRALVTESEFRRANRKQKRHPANRKGASLCGGGMLRCGGCGAGMVASSTPGGHRFFRCRTVTCQGCTISALRVERFLLERAFEGWEGQEFEVATRAAVDLAALQAELAALDEEIREVEAAEGLSALRRAEALSGLDARREELLEQVALAGTETRRTDPEVDRALLLRLRGDYGLRKEPSADGGYRWEPDPEAEGEALENLADVLAARRFLVERLGRITVMPVNGRRNAPVEERVSWKRQETAAA